MRISIEEPNGKNPAGLKAIKVDGLVVPFVITADDQEGMVRAFKTHMVDGREQCIPDPNKPGHYQVIEMRGKVEFVWDERRWDSDRKANAALYNQVKVGKDANGDLIVRVMSAARPGAGRQLRLPLADYLGSTDASICQKAGTMAGAAAEHMCEKFGDQLDPSECARAAVDACWRMLQGGEQEAA